MELFNRVTYYERSLKNKAKVSFTNNLSWTLVYCFDDSQKGQFLIPQKKQINWLFEKGHEFYT